MSPAAGRRGPSPSPANESRTSRTLLRTPTRHRARRRNAHRSRRPRAWRVSSAIASPPHMSSALGGGPPELGEQGAEGRIGADRLEIGVGFESADVAPAAPLALAE